MATKITTLKLCGKCRANILEEMIVPVCSPCRSSAFLLGLTDYSEVDMLGVRYKSVNFGADQNPGEANV